MSIYKACDIRGRFGEDLQESHAQKLGQAIALLKGSASVLVAGDGRVSTPMLKKALIGSLVQSGCSVVDLGMVPTPLFYFARRRLGIQAGVMVTASHNPAGDNGFKITLGPLPVTEEEMKALEQLMESDLPVVHGPAGSCREVDLLDEYLDSLAGLTPDLTGFNVVVDCASGMAGLAARRVWERTGAGVTYLLETVDGRFPAHAPNPAEAKNLSLLQQEVLRQDAQLGAAYDGDADRVTFIDEQGRPVPSDKAIVLFARQGLSAVGEAGGEKQVIIYDQKCSRIVRDAVHALGGEPVMERSGHTYIKRAFLTRGAVYAGELSGHHFFRAIHGDDGLAASLFFARLVQQSGLPLSRLVDSIPSYPITPDIRLPMTPAGVQELIDNLEAALSAPTPGQERATLTYSDGLRIEFPDSWALIRASVTEPVVTLRFEGVDEPSLLQVMRVVENAAPELRGKLGG